MYSVITIARINDVLEVNECLFTEREKAASDFITTCRLKTEALLFSFGSIQVMFLHKKQLIKTFDAKIIKR